MGSKRMRETIGQMSLSRNFVVLVVISEYNKVFEEQVDDVTVISVAV